MQKVGNLAKVRKKKNAGGSDGRDCNQIDNGRTRTYAPEGI